MGYLYKESVHGYELHKHMMDEFGTIWHSSQSQTYNILKRLQEQGFITATSLEQNKRPLRQMLQLSETGKFRFESWLNKPTRCSVHAIRVEFITRLYFMRQYYPDNVVEMTMTQAEVVQAGIDQLEAQRYHDTDIQKINRLSLELRIKLLRSVHEWLVSLCETIQY